MCPKRAHKVYPRKDIDALADPHPANDSLGAGHCPSADTT